MPAAKGTQPPGGSRRGVPNKITGDVKAMVLAALTQAGGERYLLAQAHDNPRAFLTLLGRIIPLQVTGKDGAPLVPHEAAVDPSRLALALLNIIRSAPPSDSGEATAIETTSGAPR